MNAPPSRWLRLSCTPCSSGPPYSNSPPEHADAVLLATLLPWSLVFLARGGRSQVQRSIYGGVHSSRTEVTLCRPFTCCLRPGRPTFTHFWSPAVKPTGNRTLDQCSALVIRFSDHYARAACLLLEYAASLMLNEISKSGSQRNKLDIGVWYPKDLYGYGENLPLVMVSSCSAGISTAATSSHTSPSA